jgi:glutathione S-transferase
MSIAAILIVARSSEHGGHSSEETATMTTQPPTPAQPIRLHTFSLSGHAHRAELFLSLLQLPYVRQEVNLLTRAQRGAEFLKLNPFGKVPVIQDGDVTLPDSAAILVYLALRYDGSGRWLPRDPVGAAQVQRWLSLAAGPLVNGAASARWLALNERTPDTAMLTTANDLLDQIEAHLEGRDYLVGDGPTIADIAMYSYTAHVPEAGVSLEPHPRVCGWLARLQALPGFIDMPHGADASKALAACKAAA